jgi:hypothetical protein
MVVFGWLFDGSPWWHDALVIGLGMVAAAVGNAARLRRVDGRGVGEREPPRWPELERPPNEHELP